MTTSPGDRFGLALEELRDQLTAATHLGQVPRSEDLRPLRDRLAHVQDAIEVARGGGAGGGRRITLLPHHRERLETASAFQPEVVSARGYHSVADARRAQRARLPARHRPVPARRSRSPSTRSGTSSRARAFEPTGLLLRPDTLYTFPDGRAAKYLRAGEAAERARRPPARARVAPRRRSCRSCSPRGWSRPTRAVSVGLAAIGLGGVDGGWRNGAPLPEWELVPLKGRQVLIAFDSDVTVKRSVRGALHRLVGYLQPARRPGRDRRAAARAARREGRAGRLPRRASRLARTRSGCCSSTPTRRPRSPTTTRPPRPSCPADMTGADVLDRVGAFVTRFVHFSSDEERWARRAVGGARRTHSSTSTSAPTSGFAPRP